MRRLALDVWSFIRFLIALLLRRPQALAVYRQVRDECRWCHGRRTFHPHLPLACPVCNGTGKRKR